MATHDHLNPGQFGQHPRKDPGEKKKAKFGADPAGSKTMAVESAGLPKAPKRHPHRRHAGARTRRAR